MHASARNVGTKALFVIAAWVLMAGAWTPPTAALQINAGAPAAQTRFAVIFVC